MANPIVETKQGKIKGIARKTPNNVPYTMFRGIPFARPPVGELRFAIPQPPEPWQGVRDGTLEYSICAQFDRESGAVVGSEDCLYLNVYTPKLPPSGTSLPVMVFIHGGGFLFGSGTDITSHGPDFLVEKDVILVTPNYRIGILGFLSLDCKEAPGNMGLRDQVLALKWVQENIANFGGDPNNVTIFGISAGGASVEYLMLSPLTKGLFHKAIAQSGSSLVRWAQSKSKNVKGLATKIAKSKGKDLASNGELLKYLKSLPLKELVAESVAAVFSESFKGGIHFGFVPVVENPTDWEPFISQSTYLLLANGEFSKVPFVTGVCSREGLLMVSHGSALLEKLKNGKKFIDHFPFDLDDIEKPEVEAKLNSVYLEDNKTSGDDDAFAIDFFSDADFVGGVYTAAKLIAKNHSPVYFYEFAYDGALNYLKKKLNINREGACHGDDGGYILSSAVLTDTLNETDKYVKNMTLDLWTNFAKTGDPNPRDTSIPVKWEPIAETKLTYLVIDKKPTIKYELHPARTSLYEDMYKKKFGGELFI